jgi:hypothetical protein
VCDPRYTTDNQDATAKHQPIRIHTEEDVLHGPMSCYHLDFYVDLPPKSFKFEVFGDNLEQLSRPFDSIDVTAAKSITFGLACTMLEASGCNERLWHITLKVNPASKLLHVFRAIEMPFRCSMGTKCQSAGEDTAVEKIHQCLICVGYNFTLCDNCWTVGEVAHPHNSFEAVDLVQRVPGPQQSTSRVAPLAKRHRNEIAPTAPLPPETVSMGGKLAGQDLSEEAPSPKRARQQRLPAEKGLNHSPRSFSADDDVDSDATIDESLDCELVVDRVIADGGNSREGQLIGEEGPSAQEPAERTPQDLATQACALLALAERIRRVPDSANS